jgi:hypothetical protein
VSEKTSRSALKVAPGDICYVVQYLRAAASAAHIAAVRKEAWNIHGHCGWIFVVNFVVNFVAAFVAAFVG